MFNLSRFLNLNLSNTGLLGINGRNIDYIFESNRRRYYPLVDDKLKTIELANAAGIASPEIFHVVESYHDRNQIHYVLKNYEDFVIKPARGSGGGGIIVVAGQLATHYVKASGSPISKEALSHHISNILSGLFSLGSMSDKAIVQYRIKKHEVFEKIAYQGVPDIRIIVYRGIPVMAMLRLPTKASDGKANLHVGGVGVGIDIATGRTNFAVLKGGYIHNHPDVDVPLTGIQMPYWDKLLEMSARFHETLPLNYIGVDLVIDIEKGPMLLELNARPGLAIQIANNAGLKPRLEKVTALNNKKMTLAERIAFSKENF